MTIMKTRRSIAGGVKPLAAGGRVTTLFVSLAAVSAAAVAQGQVAAPPTPAAAAPVAAPAATGARDKADRCGIRPSDRVGFPATGDSGVRDRVPHHGPRGRLVGRMTMRLPPARISTALSDNPRGDTYSLWNVGLVPISAPFSSRTAITARRGRQKYAREIPKARTTSPVRRWSLIVSRAI